MITQLEMWAEDLFALAYTYLQKVSDAGNIQELTTPLPPKSIGPTIPDPTNGIGAAKGASNTPTHDTYLSRCDHVTGLQYSSDPTSNSEINAAVNVVYVSGTDLDALNNILGDLKGKVSASSAVLANLLGGAASITGIVASFIPVLGQAYAGAAVTGGIAAALIGGASTAVHIAGSQVNTTASDAIGTLISTVSGIQAAVVNMPHDAKTQIGIMLTEADTYAQVPSGGVGPGGPIPPLPGENYDYQTIASATFTLSYYTVQQAV